AGQSQKGMLSETCQIEGISSPESAPFPFDRTLFPAPSFPIARRSRLTFRGRGSLPPTEPARNAKVRAGIVGNGENRIIKGNASPRLRKVAAHTQSGHGTWNPPGDCSAPALLQPLHGSRVSG